MLTQRLCVVCVRAGEMISGKRTSASQQRIGEDISQMYRSKTKTEQDNEYLNSMVLFAKTIIFMIIIIN